MGQVIQVNGDYNIKASSGASIILDPGASGRVLVTGSLIVEGDSLDITTQDLFIKDNVIILNDGEQGQGVSLGVSGIKIDRGQSSNVGLYWDESLNGWKLASGSESDLTIDANSKLTLRQIATDPTVDSGNLVLIGAGAGVVTVAGTNGYENQVTTDDDIPNKRYVDLAIFNRPNYRIGVGNPPADLNLGSYLKNDNTIVLVSDPIIPDSVDDFESLTGEDFFEPVVSILVNGSTTPTAQFFENEIKLEDLKIADNEITNRLSNGDVYVNNNGTGNLRTNNALRFDHSSQPALVSQSTLIYGNNPGIGTTGLYFKNDSSTERYRNGELVSKNRALLFSMIF